MVCALKVKRNIFYKKMLLDVWGHHFIYHKISKALSFIKRWEDDKKAKEIWYSKDFIYKLDKPHDFKEKRRLKRKFLNHRLLKNFYIVLSYNNFRKYYGLARRKSGSFVGNYLVYLEGRLFMLAYRSNFITNIFLIRHVIKQGIFLINGVVCNQYNYIVKPWKIIEIESSYKEIMKKDLNLRLEKKIIFYKAPDYLFINYNFFFILYYRQPKMSDLVFPINIDVYSAIGHYFP